MRPVIISSWKGNTFGEPRMWRGSQMSVSQSSVLNFIVRIKNRQWDAFFEQFGAPRLACYCCGWQHVMRLFSHQMLLLRAVGSMLCACFLIKCCYCVRYTLHSFHSKRSEGTSGLSESYGWRVLNCRASSVRDAVKLFVQCMSRFDKDETRCPFTMSLWPSGFQLFLRLWWYACGRPLVTAIKSAVLSSRFWGTLPRVKTGTRIFMTVVTST